MTLPLTPDSLAAAYDYLRTTPPFKRWKLPVSDEVEFRVTRHRGEYGAHDVRRSEHCVWVSSSIVTTTERLMMTMAHEMLHAYQDGIAKTATRTVHNREFHRLAARVCKSHGWAVGEFI